MERVADISIDSDGEELQLRIKPGGRLKSALAWLFNFPASNEAAKNIVAAPPAEKQEAPSRHAIAGAQPKPSLRAFDDAADEAIANAYVFEKLSIPELVQRFGGTGPSIGAALDRQNVKRRSTSEAMMISHARRAGVDPTKNSAYVPGRGGFTPEQEAEMCRRYLEDLDAPSDLAIAYGVSAPVIRSVLDRHNVPMRNSSEARQAVLERKRRKAGASSQTADLSTQSPAERAFGRPSVNLEQTPVAPAAPPIAAPVPRKDEVIDGPMRRQNDGPTKRAATDATEPSRESAGDDEPDRDDDEAELARLEALAGQEEFDRDDEIERLYRAGLSSQQVADRIWSEYEIAVGVQTVNRVLKARGVAKRTISEAMLLKQEERRLADLAAAKLPPAPIPPDAPVEEIVIDPMRKLYNDNDSKKGHGWAKKEAQQRGIKATAQKRAAERSGPITPAVMQDAVEKYFAQGGTVKRVTAIEAPKAGGTPVGNVGFGGRTRRSAPG